MSKQIDAYSFALGVCADFLPACEAVARKYGCKAYYLKEPLITDLFPVSLNRSKQNIVFYREDRDLKEFLSIQHDKQTLIAENNYTGENRRQIAVRYGHLLSYSDEAIARYLSQNTELE